LTQLVDLGMMPPIVDPENLAKNDRHVAPKHAHTNARNKTMVVNGPISFLWLKQVAGRSGETLSSHVVI
jgi:hypothetical protein